MPYSTIAELPDSTKKLPKHGKEIYLAAFNNSFKSAEDEGRAHAIAWAAVKKIYKEEDGQWVLKEAKVTTKIAVKEAMSDNDRRTLLQGAVTGSLAVGNSMDGPWIRDIYSDYLVYEVKNKMFRMAWVIDQKGKVVLGDAERVTPQTIYTPVQEKVEAKIETLTKLTSEREDVTEARESLDNLLELLEREDLTEAIAEPHLKKADEVIAKLQISEAMKTEDGAQYPMAAFAYTPEADKPSDWKLRLWESPVKKVTKAQLNIASAYLSIGGYRGVKVEILREALPDVRMRVRAEYKKLGTKDADISKWVKEGNMGRERVAESCEIDISEASKEGVANGILPVRIIKPGFNNSKGRFYSDSAVADAGTIFEGTKMYADHPAKGDRPERSVRDWVATLHETKVSEAGNAVGVAHIHAGWLKEMVSNLYEQGDLKQLGTSINAVGNVTKQTVQGVKTVLVEGLVKTGTQSVDFVTEAGAGGQAGLRESVSDTFVDAELMDLATLREARPDLVEAVESDIKAQINTEVKHKMELEEKVTDLEGQVTTLTAERDTLKEAQAQAEKDRAKADAQAVIKEAVNKAELPEAAKTKLMEAHKEDESGEGIEEAIKAEKTYIAALTGKGKITDLGPSDTKTDEKVKEDLVEAFTELTGSKEAGEIAAKGR